MGAPPSASSHFTAITFRPFTSTVRPTSKLGIRTSVSLQSAAGAAWMPLRDTRASWLRLIRNTKLPDGTSGNSNSLRSQRLVVLIGGGILWVRGNASGEPRGAGEVLQAVASKFREVHSGAGDS